MVMASLHSDRKPKTAIHGRKGLFWTTVQERESSWWWDLEATGPTSSAVKNQEGVSGWCSAGFFLCRLSPQTWKSDAHMYGERSLNLNEFNLDNPLI